MLEEFRKFVLRGSVVDLAVGVVIGVAFGAIVASLVADIIMPIVGAITGGLDFSNYDLTLSRNVRNGAAYADARKQGAVPGYGQFLTVALNFLIVAAVLFLVVKAHESALAQGGGGAQARRAPRRRPAPHADPRSARDEPDGNTGLASLGCRLG